jgi:hypothetical protein
MEITLEASGSYFFRTKLNAFARPNQLQQEVMKPEGDARPAPIGLKQEAMKPGKRRTFMASWFPA